jgi:OCT family organic cation transporter-like MFS transporter 4/5
MPFLCYYWFVPESARWLVSTGQLLQARKVLHRIAYINRRTLANAEKKLYDDLQRESRIRPKRYSYSYVLISLFKSPVMRQRCLIIFYIMMTNLMVYLGIGMGITTLTNEHPYEIFLFSIFAELFGLCLCHFCATKFGRKIPLIIFFTLCSLSILTIPLTHKTYPIISLSSALCAKLFISASQALSWIYASETYPTVIRSTGVGLSVSIARLGGVWAPQISLLAQSVWFPLPYIIFSVCSFIAAICAMFLPETRTKLALPETIKQAEKSDHHIPIRPQQLNEVREEIKIKNKKLSVCPEVEEEEEENSTNLEDMKSDEEFMLTTVGQEDKIETVEKKE